MIERVPVDQVAMAWSKVVARVSANLPPSVYESGLVLNNILAALLAGRMQLWLIGEGDRLDGVTITTMAADPFTGVVNLLAYSVASMNGGSEVDPKVWMEGATKLKEYAEARGCYQVVGYTKSKKVRAMVEAAGGDASWSFVAIPVDPSEVYEQLRPIVGGRE